jgi:queuosine precursor transporter
LGYICGDLLNDKVFRKLKTKHEDMTGFSLRAILSSCVGEMCDSFVFITIGLIGQMPVASLITMWVAQVTLKLGYEAIILPFTCLITRKVAWREQMC